MLANWLGMLRNVLRRSLLVDFKNVYSLLLFVHWLKFYSQKAGAVNTVVLIDWQRWSKNGAHNSCSCQHADRCTSQKKDTKEFDRLNYSCKPHPWIFSDADCYETQSQTSFDHSFRLMISPDFNKVCHPLSNSFVGMLGVRHSKQLHACSCQHADRCTSQKKKDSKEFDRLNYSYKPHPWIFSDADCYETQSQTSFDHSFRLMISPDFNKVCHPLSNSFVGMLGVRHSKQLHVWFSSSSSSVFFNLNINLIILFHHVITAFIFICFFYLFIFVMYYHLSNSSPTCVTSG